MISSIVIAGIILWILTRPIRLSAIVKGVIVGFLLLITVGVLSGCATYYSHPTKGQAQFDQDYVACEYEANIATASMDVPDYDYTKTTRIRELVGQCLSMNGWTEYYE